MSKACSLASVIGEEELSPEDKQYLEFGRQFESKFVNQGFSENRTIEQSLDLGWELLTILPRESLDRLDDVTLDKYYEPAKKRVQQADTSEKGRLNTSGLTSGNGPEPEGEAANE